MNILQLLAYKYIKLTIRSTRRHHQAKEAKSCLQAVSVRAIGAWGSMQSKIKLAAEKRRQTFVLSKIQKREWIEDYVERETAVAGTRGDNAETVFKHEWEAIRNGDNAGLTTRESEEMFQELIMAIRGSIRDLASSDNEVDTDDADGVYTELGKLREDDEPSWVVRITSKTVQQCIGSFCQK